MVSVVFFGQQVKPKSEATARRDSVRTHSKRLRTPCFHFFVKAGLLNYFNCNPVPARNQEPSSRGALKSGLASADSGLPLDLEDRAKRCLSEHPAQRLIQPCRKIR